MEEFVVQCVGYTQDHEKNFTIGKEYVVRDGCITTDFGYTYAKDRCMTKDSSPDTWWLSGWYRFEIVNDDIVVPEHLEVSFEDVLY